jgi:hypothetical protein
VLQVPSACVCVCVCVCVRVCVCVHKGVTVLRRAEGVTVLSTQ